MAHFNRKFIVHKGKRKNALAALNNSQPQVDKNGQPITSTNNDVKMYQLRKNPYSAICTRCIQLETADSSLLCSEFCYIVCVPFNNNSSTGSHHSNTKGIVYVWIGRKANPDEGRICEEIAREIYDVSQMKTTTTKLIYLIDQLIA